MYISYLEGGLIFPHVYISCNYGMPVTAAQEYPYSKKYISFVLVLLAFKKFSFTSPIVPI